MAAEKAARDRSVGQWPSPDAKTPATGGLGLTGDRSIAFFSRVSAQVTRCGTAWFLDSPLFAAENQIVAVDHFGPARIAKD